MCGSDTLSFSRPKQFLYFFSSFFPFVLRLLLFDWVCYFFFVFHLVGRVDVYAMYLYVHVIRSKRIASSHSEVASVSLAMRYDGGRDIHCYEYNSRISFHEEGQTGWWCVGCWMHNWSNEIMISVWHNSRRKKKVRNNNPIWRWVERMCVVLISSIPNISFGMVERLGTLLRKPPAAKSQHYHSILFYSSNVRRHTHSISLRCQ